MKLNALIGDRSLVVEVNRDEKRVYALIDEREYELEVSEPEKNTYLLKHEGRIYEFFVGPRSSPNDPLIVSSSKGDIEVQLSDPKRLRGSSSASGHTDGDAEIKTAMPGKVVRILMAEGDAAEKGDAVLVVEAMKMQNDLKAPKSGLIKEIRVSEGQTVSAGDVLAVIE